MTSPPSNALAEFQTAARELLSTQIKHAESDFLENPADDDRMDGRREALVEFRRRFEALCGRFREASCPPST
jgi:hypothetical protein